MVATNTMSREGYKRFPEATVWCSYHTLWRAFRGRKRESFPRAGSIFNLNEKQLFALQMRYSRPINRGSAIDGVEST